MLPFNRVRKLGARSLRYGHRMTGLGQCSGGQSVVTSLFGNVTWIGRFLAEEVITLDKIIAILLPKRGRVGERASRRQKEREREY